MKNPKRERMEQMDRLHRNLDLELSCHSAMAIYQRKGTTGALAGKFVPFQKTADCKVSITPYASKLGPRKSGHMVIWKIKVFQKWMCYNLKKARAKMLL